MGNMTGGSRIAPRDTYSKDEVMMYEETGAEILAKSG
jgi:hypothetical protein